MGHRTKPLRRASGSRAEQSRFLIYCEGECTEDQYFKGLRQELRSLPVTINIGPDHGEPLSLVRSAIKHKERAERSAADRYTPYDEVWCVVDIEAPVRHPSLDEAIKLARRSGVHLALSNPCFELWLLLHIKDVSAYQTSAAAQKAMEDDGACGYAVQRKHLDYIKLVGPDGARHGMAKERARKLRASTDRGHRANPWTDVDILVELLHKARSRGR
ncbi:RloB family protein [Streptomyces antarcticus]|uniref:RloB family protein n=1 Tax=Streptomyces antarcticus TaxID=2996458 RepID=UPI00226D5E49|nr:MULTISPECIES: RloB family protein [unclassified Streptomyces]MCY0947686.1 RloB family protein [Streptomyces sp. H34-AA3]MCZ4085551.1 RloB family protein [Streptomyces sp. H34-S5]